MNGIIVKAFTFNLYQQLLSPALHVEWDDLVDELCFTKDWLDDKGVQSTAKHGQPWDNLNNAIVPMR